MRTSIAPGVAAVALFLAAGVGSAHAQQAPLPDDDGIVRTFAVLPERVEPDPSNPGQFVQVGHPEGLEVDRNGYVYAATFESNFSNHIYVYAPDGHLDALLAVPPDGKPLGRAPLGMVSNAEYLYVNEVLNGDILRYRKPVKTGDLPDRVYDICGGFIAAFGLADPGTEFCALNDIDLGPDGRLYIGDNGAGPTFVFSDAFRNGRIFVLDPRTGESGVWFDEDPRGELDVAYGGFPEFGVNGVAFNPQGNELYLANMSTDVIYRMTVSNCHTGCRPGPLKVFAKGGSINGPDNIVFDENGVLWVASGQNDRVVGLNRAGHEIARIGSFEGFTAAGVPEGLLQPSGIGAYGGKLFVGNESSRGLRPTPDMIPESEWQKLRQFTVSVVYPWVYGTY